MTTDPATEIFYALRNSKTGEYIRGLAIGGRLIKAPALYEARMRAHHARAMRPEVDDPADWEAVPVRVVPAEHYDELLALALEYRAVAEHLPRSEVEAIRDKALEEAAEIAQYTPTPADVQDHALRLGYISASQAIATAIRAVKSGGRQPRCVTASMSRPG